MVDFHFLNLEETDYKIKINYVIKMIIMTIIKYV
jgi:hypothetical protein